jgi:hypothetical protein
MNSLSSIEAFVADMAPVKRVDPRRGMIVVGVLALVASVFVVVHYGARADLAEGYPGSIVLLRGGMLLLLGISSLFAVTASARPSVGQAHNGWRWMLAAALLFPAAALVQFIWSGDVPQGALAPAIGHYCLKISGVSALLMGSALTLWLRQGAPTGLNRAGWLVGLTAGSFGTFAYSLHCPMNNIFYIGLWYSLAVGTAAAVGRLVVPRIIRW